MSWCDEPFIDPADPNVIRYPSGAADWLAARRNAFEGTVAVKDPWSSVFGNEEARDFQVSPEELLRRARATRPHEREATVSAFSDWVYELYRAKPSYEGMARGRAAEELWSEPICFRPDFSSVKSTLWSLAFDGMGGAIEQAAVLSAPSLLIGGQPLKGRPDLVYRHRYESCVVIVEVKCTTKPIPRALWPNVWAQLWAYSRIAEYHQAERVVVLAEIWADYGGELILRRLVRRDPRRANFDRFYRELFSIYQAHLA